MSGTKTRTKQTSKSTVSASKKQSPSLKTQKRPSGRTTQKTTLKKGLSSSAEVNENEVSLLSSAKGTLTKTAKRSALSQQENSHPKKKGAWEGYDFENLPHLSDEQLASFRKVTPEEHERFKRIVSEGKKVGRPLKPQEEKEHIRSIRISDHLLEAIKTKADKLGIGWQTYVKKVVSEDLQI